MVKTFEKEDYFKRIIILAVLVQIAAFIYYQFTKTMNIDECMLLLNARSIARDMTDALGQKWPSYFNTWIFGGQSALPTYLTALVVKLFGYHLWLERLLMLLLSLASLFAGVNLIKDIFPNKALGNVAITLFVLQPWRILQSCWLLDCAFFTHFFIIGLYFLNKALISEKKYLKLFVSMLFFALGCYSYQPAIIATAVFLLAYFLILLFKKKTKFAYAFFSAVVFSALAIPLVLSMLTLSNILDSFKLFGFTFVSGENFTRQNTLIYSDGAKFFDNLINNLKGVFEIMLFPDLMLFLGFGSAGCKVSLGILSYGHLLSAAGVAAGIVAAVKNRKKLIKSEHAFPVALIVASLISYLIFSISVNYNMTCGHRYTVFYFAFNIIAGAGLYLLLKKKKLFSGKAAKAALAVFIALSIALTAYCVYGFVSTKVISIAANGLEEVYEKYEENPSRELIFIGQDARDYSRFSVFVRHRFFDEAKDFEPLYDEMMYEYKYSDKKPKSDEKGRVLVKSDGSVKLDFITEGKTLDAERYIISAKEFDSVMSGIDLSEYEIYENGCFYLLTKKQV